MITPNSYEEEYGGKTICFLEARHRGEVFYRRTVEEQYHRVMAADLEHYGCQVTVRKFGKVIYGGLPDETD